MPAAAIAGAAVVGAGATIVAGNKAAKAQKNAANQASADAARADATNRYIFDTTREDYRPYREVGTAALGKLAGMYGVRPSAQGMFFEGMDGPQGQPSNDNYGGFQESPGYRFRVDEATRAIERSAAARGGLRSGATMDALQRRVQGVASDEYENYANRLAALAGVGQNANQGSAQAGQAFGAATNQNAGLAANAALAAGNARASGYANTGAAINSGVQNLTAAYLYNQGYGGFGGAGGVRTGGTVQTPGFGGGGR